MITRNLPGGQRGRRVWLTTSPLWADCLEDERSSTFHNHMDLHSLLP
jgi:hypothetical protein